MDVVYKLCKNELAFWQLSFLPCNRLRKYNKIVTHLPWPEISMFIVNLL